MCNSDSYIPQVLLAIDPGNEYSAFCFVDIETYRPLYFAKEKNEDVLGHVVAYCANPQNNVTNMAIEMLSSYGMSVGASVLFTAVWLGRFHQLFSEYIPCIDYIYRRDEKLCLCGQMRAKDTNIRQALIDRFAKFDFKSGKGTKDNPDWFFGFKADVWQSFAIATTWIDAHKGLYELTK